MSSAIHSFTRSAGRGIARHAIAIGVILMLAGCASSPGVHQRGNTAILEGHEMHRYSIELTRTPGPGRHPIGLIPVHGLGDLPVEATIGKDGEIEAIDVLWPDAVRPEHLAFVTHDVYESDGGKLRVAGKAKCTLMHAGGQCMGCSQYIWVELIIRTRL